MILMAAGVLLAFRMRPEAKFDAAATTATA
jgi:hypothetical protein